MTYPLAADAARRDAARPARQKRDTMAAFPGVALNAAQPIHAPMSVKPDAFVSPRVHLDALRAIVTGKDDERIGRQAGAGQRGEDIANRVIHLRDEIAVIAGLAAAFDGRRWHDRVMGRSQREVEEKWLGGVRGLFEVAHGPQGEFREDVGKIPAGHRRTRTVEAAFA